MKRGDLDGAPVTAPLEPCLLPGSVLTPSLVAMLLTEKFCYHQPFYRMEWRLRATHGIELRRDLMCSWHNHMASMLLPLHERLKEKMRAGNYLKVDETPIRCLEPGHGKTIRGYLWTYHHPGHGVLFDWHNSRGADCLKEVLTDETNAANSFGGHLQSDGYSAYRAFMARHPGLNIQPVSCLAHIRRKFVEAREDQPRISAWVLIQIGKIYELEARLRQRGAGPELRRRARRRWSLRIYQHLTRLTRHLILRHRITPRSPLGKALHYAQDQWPHLEACFEHGQIDFDNNSVENAIRPTKLGHNYANMRIMRRCLARVRCSVARKSPRMNIAGPLGVGDLEVSYAQVCLSPGMLPTTDGGKRSWHNSFPIRGLASGERIFPKHGPAIHPSR